MILLLIALLLVTILCIDKYKKSNKHFDKYPGPPSRFFLASDIVFCRPHAVLNKFLEYYKKYGGVFKIRLSPFSNGLMLADPKYLEFVLSSNKLIDKGPQYKAFSAWVGNGLITSTGTTWKSHRRIITPTFHFSILEQFVDVFNDISEILIKKLGREVGKNSVNVEPLAGLYALDVICETAMGVSLNAQENDSEYIRNLKEVAPIIADRFFSPLKASDFIYHLTNDYREEQKRLKMMHNFTNHIIAQRKEERKKQTEEKKRPAFLDMLLKVNEAENNVLSDLELREEVDTFMFAGYDTTTSAISLALHCLAQNQDVQEKLLEELETICGNKKRITYEELQKLSYLDCVIKETLRLFPSAPYISRTFKEDVEFDGRVLPKDCMIMMSPFLAHRDPKTFPNPEKFDPERFRNGSTRAPYSYIPFSAGPRNCIGQRFAVLDLKTVIAKVVLHFKLLPSIPQRPVEVSAEVVLKLRGGVFIRFAKRE